MPQMTYPSRLMIASEDGRDHEMKDLNYETAARSTRWLIGASETALEAYVRQVRG